jgi:cytosine permease
MSAEKKGKILEDYGAVPVPAEQRRGWFGMGIIIWGVAICIPAFMLGGMMGSMLGVGRSVVAALLGSLILTVISVLTGIVGAHTRVSTAMSTQFAFGRYGNIIFALLLFLGTFGWFGVQLEMFGAAIGGAVKAIGGDGAALPRWIPIVGGGILMSLTALVGYKAIEKLSMAVIPILLALMIITLVLAFRGLSLAEVAAKPPAQPMPFGLVVSIVAGAFAVGAVIQPDITRYAKSKGHASVAMVFGMMIGFPLVLILSSLLGAASGQADFTSIMFTYHTGWWAFFAMFVIVFATWTTNDNNLYSGVLSIFSLIRGLPKWLLTVIGGAVGTILALAGITGHFVTWLSVLGVTLPPIGAVMVVDFFLFKGSDYTYDKLASLPPVRVVPIVSWVIATAFGFLTNYKVFTFTSAPALDTIIVSAVLHFILMLVTGNAVKGPGKATRA